VAKEKILVLEDAVDISTILKIYFTSQGYEVITTNRGRTTIDICRQTPPNLALLDVHLPDISGFEVGKALRQSIRTRHIPIIFLTALSEKKNRLEGLGEVQAEYYIVKPFDIEEVHTIVKGVLDRARQKSLAHPLTNLPTGGLINEQYRILLSNTVWSLAQVRINNFEAFNRVYGIVAGEDVLRFTASLLGEVVNEMGSADDFIGQRAVGHDLIITSSPDRLPAICEKLCKRFDEGIKVHYTYKDRRNGGILAKDVQGNYSWSPFMALMAGVITSEDGPFYDVRELSESAEEVLQRALSEARLEGYKSHISYGRTSIHSSVSDSYEEIFQIHPSQGYMSVPEARELLQNISNNSSKALIALHLAVDPTEARKLFKNGAIELLHVQQAIPLDDTDMAVIVSTDAIAETIDHMIEHFYSHPIVQEETILTFGWASGPYQSANELIDAVARDFADRRQSQGIDDSSEPAILVMQPGRSSIRQRLSEAIAKRDALRIELDAKRGLGEQKISNLTAIVVHDLNSGLTTLKTEINRTLIASSEWPMSIQEKLLWLDKQVAICIAWQQSIASLGNPRSLNLQSVDIAFWLKEKLQMMCDQLEINIALEIEVPEALQATIDTQLLTVACLHLLLSIQHVGAHSLRITSNKAHGSGGFELEFAYNGSNWKRIYNNKFDTSMSESKIKPWQHKKPVLLERTLNSQSINLKLSSKSDHMSMVWQIPDQQRALDISLLLSNRNANFLSFSAIVQDMLRTEQEIKEIQLILHSHRYGGDMNINTIKESLYPYAQELMINLQRLTKQTELLLTQEGNALSLLHRIHNISLYCYLLVCNLTQVLQGADLPIEKVDINEQIHQVLDLLEHKLFHIKEIPFKTEPNLPFVSISSVEIKQVLMNVLKNAEEATDLDGSLCISTKRINNKVLIQIEDTGHGILPEHRDKIFELNFSTKGRGSDSGIGLYSVNSIVQRAGGRIRLASAALNAIGELVAWQSDPDLEETLQLGKTGTILQIELPIAEE
jgi:signal transduction histidine kinase/DNA-binding response OmpR family regulator